MTQINHTCRGWRPGGARRPGAHRVATRRTRLRVSSDAVVSAYIHDIARPIAGGVQHDRHPNAGFVDMPRTGLELAPQG